MNAKQIAKRVLPFVVILALLAFIVYAIQAGWITTDLILSIGFLIYAAFWGIVNWIAYKGAAPTRMRGRPSDPINWNGETPPEEDDDRLVDRDRYWRTWVATTSAIAMFLFPVYIGLYIGFKFTIVAGIVAGGALIGAYVRYLLAYCPQLYALVSEDPARDEFVAYGAGWHARFWWELISRSSFESLVPRIIRFTETYQAKNGEVTVGVFIQFRVPLYNVLVFVRFGIDEVFEGLTSTIRMFLTQKLVDKSSEEIMREDILGEYLNKNVRELPSSVKSTLQDHAQRTGIEPNDRRDDEDRLIKGFNSMSIHEALEAIYGIDFIAYGVRDVEESEAVKDARGAAAEIELIIKPALDLVGAKTVEEAIAKNREAWERAINTMAAFSGKNADLSIWRIEGVDEGTGKALAAAQGALGKGRGGKR